MPVFRVPRMQTNAAWISPAITFKAGNPSAIVSAAGWTFSGVALGANGSRIDLATQSRMTVADGKLTIALTIGDCASLGPGRVQFEIMRQSPSPTRPVLRFALNNVAGL